MIEAVGGTISVCSNDVNIMSAKRSDIPELHDVLRFVYAAHPVEANATIGMCTTTWNNASLWSYIVDMHHTPKRANGETALSATRLVLASKKGHLAAVERLLSMGANIEAEDDRGRTALSAACKKGHVHVASLLLDKNACIESKCNRGRTPLLWAAAFDFVHVVELLRDRKANLSVIDNDGKGAMFHASRNDNGDMISCLRKKGGHVDNEPSIYY